MLRFTAFMHQDLTLSQLRVAILNYLVAKSKNDNFLLRISDLNKEKNIEGKDTEIIQILEKFAIKDDMRYHQSERESLHQKLATSLLQSNQAYLCVCSDESECKCQELDTTELSKIKQNKTPFVIKTKATDKIDSFVILNKDASSTYDFAMACDDMFDDIDTIIALQDENANLQKQTYIKNLLGFSKDTKIYLIPPIDTQISLEYLLKEGFIPDAIINYLLLLGYNDDIRSEIFTLPEAIKWYDVSKINSNNIFDIEKLKEINKQHLLNMDDKELSKVFGFADSDIGKLAKIYLDRCNTINELEAKIKPIFSPKDFDNSYSQQMKIAQDIIFNAPMIDTFDELKKYILSKSTLNAKDLDIVLSLLMTNQKNDLTNLDKIYTYIKTYILEVIS
jgi:glutamyl-tRNA synthetase